MCVCVGREGFGVLDAWSFVDSYIHPTLRRVVFEGNKLNVMRDFSEMEIKKKKDIEIG